MMSHEIFLVATAERDSIHCPVDVLPPNTNCGTYTCNYHMINEVTCSLNR